MWLRATGAPLISRILGNECLQFCTCSSPSLSSIFVNRGVDCLLPITINEQIDADRPFVRRMLEQAALTTYADLASLGRISLRERLEEIFDRHYAVKGRRIWIARAADGTSIGLVWIQPGRHPITERPEFIVINLAVEEAQRGKGVGRQLMQHARAYAETQGITRLRLFVSSENAAALKLYESLGFAERTREMVWQF